jgi:hypothetical protein
MATPTPFCDFSVIVSPGGPISGAKVSSLGSSEFYNGA